MNVGAHSTKSIAPQPTLLWAHKAAIWAIGKLPQFNNCMLFRAYNRALRLFHQEYIGKTYFGALMHCNLSDLIQLYVFNFWSLGA